MPDASSDRQAGPVSRPVDPVPQEVRRELRRVADRWSALPVGHALSLLPVVRATLEALARTGMPARPVPEIPDLGPGAAMDQLTVLAYEVAVSRPDYPLIEALVALRRALG